MSQTESESQIGPYNIIDRIGQGGTSVVYRAIDTRNDQSVALKVLTPLFATDPKFLRRFINEGKNVKLLDHPHIVRVFDASEADGRQYIAMELIEGGSLSALIKTREHILPIDETLAIIKQIADALDYAHSMGILHRDIKLSNILITADGRYVLSDFGSAKQMSMENTVVTQSGFSVGTPTFMSPEQAKGDPNIDRRTDVYSLGVAAYALLVGKLPFQADSQVALLHKIIYDAPPSPESINPTIPPGISYGLKRVLCKEPQMRYSTAGEFAEALAEGKSWIPGTMDYAAIPSQYLTRSVQIAAGSRQVDEAPDKRRWFGLMSLLSLLGIILLGLIGAIVFMTNEDLRNSIIARPSTSATATANASPTQPGMASGDGSVTGIADEIKKLESGEFLTVTDDGERFELDVPDGWIQTANGNTTNFDANNFMGRLFVHHLDTIDDSSDPQQIVESYYLQAQQDGTYKNLERSTEPTGAAIQVSDQDAYQEVFTGQWLDSDVVIRLLGVSDSDKSYVVGSIVDVAQSEQAQPFMDKLVDGFALTEYSPDRVASSTADNENSQNGAAVDETATSENGDNGVQITPTSTVLSQTATVEVTQEPASETPTSLTLAQIPATSAPTSDGQTVTARIVTATSIPATNTSAPSTDTATVTSTSIPPTGTTVPSTATATRVSPTTTSTVVPATATATRVPPTNTSTAPTAAATRVPSTNTTVPSTATATATQVPPTSTTVPPTATATQVPPTNTAVPPTATSTVVPPTSTATFTPPPTSTATFTPPPTNTTVPPTATATQVPPTQVPPTRVPPTATFTPPPPPPSPTFTPVPTRPFTFPAGAFQIIKPGPFDTDSGRTYFEWTSSVSPAPGQAYEIVFWKEGQDLLTDSFGVAAPTLAHQLTVDLEFQDKALGDLLNPGPYNWTILLVNVSPYQRVQIVGDIRELVVVRRGD